MIVHVARAALLIIIITIMKTPGVAADCYAANTTQWTWCDYSDYQKSGYSCSSTMCASASCLAEPAPCSLCARHYPSYALDKVTGQCCQSLQNNTCVHPATGDAPPNPNYGYPDHKGALIVEGPFGYNNSFPVWDGTTGLGAYGFTYNPPLGAQKWYRCRLSIPWRRCMEHASEERRFETFCLQIP